MPARRVVVTLAAGGITAVFISATMRTFISSHPDWLTEVRLPAYAPDLNPVEGAWANMKNGLGNLMARNVDQLASIIQEPAQAHSVPASVHRRVPRPDRTHPRPATAVRSANAGPSTSVQRLKGQGLALRWFGFEAESGLGVGSRRSARAGTGCA